MTIHLITGAPCSGKTTHVNTHRAPNDTLICWDTYYAAAKLSHPDRSDWTHRQIATAHRDNDVNDLLNGNHTDRTTWYIRCLATPTRRAAHITELEAAGHTVIHTHLDPGLATLLDCATNRPNPHQLARNIRDWYALDTLDTQP